MKLNFGLLDTHKAGSNFPIVNRKYYKSSTNKFDCLFKTDYQFSPKTFIGNNLFKQTNAKKSHKDINVLKNINNLDCPANSHRITSDICKTIHLRTRRESTQVKSQRITSNDLFKGTITSYEIGKEIDHGAYGTVKQCVHTLQPSTIFAIKIYKKYFLSALHFNRNIRREIRLLKTLKHPHIVRLYESIEDVSYIYMIMEYLKGGSLFSYIRSKDKHRLSEFETRQLFGQITDAVNYCHRKGIIHRDLKLQNILLDENRNIKIIDFGFAVQVQPTTKLAMYCGTPNYMAPEIICRDNYSGPAADIWALGVILYVMLTGKFPFRGISERQLFQDIIKGTYLVPTNVSHSARELIKKMLNVNPLLRPTCKDIMKDEFLCQSLNKCDNDLIFAKSALDFMRRTHYR